MADSLFSCKILKTADIDILVKDIICDEMIKDCAYGFCTRCKSAQVIVNMTQYMDRVMEKVKYTVETA